MHSVDASGSLAYARAGLLWFQVERAWRRLHHVPTLMITAAGLDILGV